LDFINDVMNDQTFCVKPVTKPLLPPIIIFLVLFAGCESAKNNTSSQSALPQQSIFSDVTDAVKLNFIHDPGVDSSYFMPESIGAGAAFFDYDNDGDLDIYLINGGPHGRGKNRSSQSPNRLFRQEQDGTFSDVTDVSGLGHTGYGMGVAVGDIDNDGDLDVYLSNYGPDVLYQNNGDGTFTDITRQARIRNDLWGCSATFLDDNLDGYLDIYVTNYVAFNPAGYCMDNAGRRDYCGPKGFPGVPDVLFRNNGNGTFTDVSRVSGIASAASRGLGVVSADFNNDHLPDLYVANDADPNNLWINRGDGTFRDMALRLGAAFNELGQAEAGMGIAIGDIENDGDPDLFISHVRFESNTLYLLEQNIGFYDNSAPAGLAGPSMPYTGFGTGFFDFDHDGDLDLAVANGRVTRGVLLTNRKPAQYWDHYAEPNMLFENLGNGKFQTLTSGEPFSTLVENSRGLAFGDVDNDGDIDVLVSNEGGRARLFRNVAEKKGHWLIVRAVAPELRRDAIGAKVTVFSLEKKWRRDILSGYSFLSSSDPRAHFGLGDHATVDSIHVKWPDGVQETFPGMEADQIVTLKKGMGEIVK
jgi:hypothetical protein